MGGLLVSKASGMCEGSWRVGNVIRDRNLLVEVDATVGEFAEGPSLLKLCAMDR